MTLNPIATLPSFDPSLDVEGYCQELLYLWLNRYFSGTPFNYINAQGQQVTATWPKCEFGFEELAMPADSLQHPMIHLYHPSGAEDADCCGSFHRVICEIIVPSTLATIPHLAGKKASQWVREVADRLHYLMSHSERGALTPGGIVRLEPLTRPSIQPALVGLYRRSFPITFIFCP